MTKGVIRSGHKKRKVMIVCQEKVGKKPSSSPVATLLKKQWTARWVSPTSLPKPTVDLVHSPEPPYFPEAFVLLLVS